MRILVCGSREWKDKEAIKLAIIEECNRSKQPSPMHVYIINGAARGADELSSEVAEELGLMLQEFPAAWGCHGRAAGPIRNAEMLRTKPDVVLAFWDGKSKGTKNMIKQAQDAKVRTRIFKYSWGIVKEVG